MKKILSLILALSICASMVSGITAFAEEEQTGEQTVEPLVLIDTSSQKTLREAGLSGDKKEVYKGELSAKWKVDEQSGITFNVPKDISAYDTISFSMKLVSKENATILFHISSENSSTEGIDYYYRELKDIKPGEWKEYEINLASFIKSRTPRGFNDIDSFTIRTTGWDNYVAPGSVFYLEDVKLIKAPGTGREVGEDVEMVLPDTSDLNGGVALMIGKSSAFAKNEITKVDKENEEVTPIIKEDRTLVPVRFISESFDAEVGWDADERKVSVALDGKNIELIIGSNKMSVDGAEQEIDVAAEIINGRTMLPLRALVEALGKNVLWDSRGLIVITNEDTVLDATEDVKLSTMLIGMLKKGIEAKNYAAAPKFTQEIIDEACAEYCNPWSATQGNTGAAIKCANAIYYLTLVSYLDPEAKASDGTLCKDAALKQIRFLLDGGNEPFACVGCYWGHAVVANALYLIKNTPVIYDEMTDDEKDRMDWLMRALAIAGNWGYNDANNYSTGFDLMGNFGKKWGPNYTNTYLTIVMNAGMYFGLDELDEIFVNFDYDTYIKKFEELGFTNIITTWSVAGAELMENGGACTLKGSVGLSNMEAGQSGGTGAGVKIPFLYNGTRAEPMNIFTRRVKDTYQWKVMSEYGTPEGIDHCYIISRNKSPFEGQMGMMTELAWQDGGKAGVASNIRSRTTYGYDSYQIICGLYANMKLLGGWDSSTEEMRKLDNRIYVGNEDLIYKMREGYHGFSSGASIDEYEYSFEASGYRYVKDIWRNFHCMLNEQVTTIKNPNKKELEKLAAAEPKDGITEAPEGAFEAANLGADTKFTMESYYPLGKEMTKGTLEFDVVMGSYFDPATYDCVIMPMQKGEGKAFSNANMLLQFTYGTLKIRNAYKYIETPIQFAPNYRYHFKVEFDVTTRKHSVEVKQIYPTEGEVYKTGEYDFRGASDKSEFIDSICIVKTPQNSDMWVENLKISD